MLMNKGSKAKEGNKRTYIRRLQEFSPPLSRPLTYPYKIVIEFFQGDPIGFGQYRGVQDSEIRGFSSTWVRN